MDPATIVLLWIASQGTWAIYWVAFRHKGDLGHSPGVSRFFIGYAVFHGLLGLGGVLSPDLATKVFGILWLVGAAAWARLAQRLRGPAQDTKSDV
jgi:hypothetical protein